MSRIIQADRSLIVACDVPYERLGDLVKATRDVEGVGGYKIPLRSGRKGWETWVNTAHEYTNKPLILDGQKLGNDIPDIGKGVMQDIAGAKFDAVILFPFTSPVTQYEWTRAAQEEGLGVCQAVK